MKKLLKISLIIGSLLLTSCNKPADQKEPPKQTSAQIPDLSKIEGEIVISNFKTFSSEQESFLDSAARIFMEKYPNTKITITNSGNPPDFKMVETENGSFGVVEQSDSFDQEIIDYKKQVTVDLLGGGGADIYSIGDIIYPIPLIDKGYLEDLNKYIENDTSFDKNNYYTNLFEAVQYKGGLYIMPTSFGFSYYSLDKEIIPNNIRTEILAKPGLKYLDMLDYGIKAREGSDNKLVTSDSLSRSLRYYLTQNLTSFIDFDNKKVSFNDGRFEKVLDTLKSYEQAGYIGQDVDYKNMDPEQFEKTLTEKYPFYQSTDMDIIYKYTLDASDNVTPEQRVSFEKMYGTREDAGLMSNDDGKSTVNIDDSFAINSNSKNKALAWAFMKFLIGDEMQQSLALDGIPVKKQALQSKISYYITESDSNTKALTEKQQKAVDDCIKVTDNYIKDLSLYIYSDKTISEILAKEIDNFVKQGQSSKATADSLQSSIELYINEQ